jgi:hypothetical protein
MEPFDYPREAASHKTFGGQRQIHVGARRNHYNTWNLIQKYTVSRGVRKLQHINKHVVFSSPVDDSIETMLRGPVAATHFLPIGEWRELEAKTSIVPK